MTPKTGVSILDYDAQISYTQQQYLYHFTRTTFRSTKRPGKET